MRHTTHATRRHFLQSAAATGALVGFDGLTGLLSRLKPVSAAEARLNPSLVRLDPSIEPLVRFLEDTPRERLLEEIADRIHKGLTYREALAALLLAGVRNVQPRPNVGFKFHAVLVVNSAHLASLNSPDTDRWLPILWAMEYFKRSQSETEKANGWKMAPVDESKVPPLSKAREAFAEAMDNWDETAADAAVAAVARTGSMAEALELFARYGPRDFRDIGHKAIFVANSFRTLQCIGWQHAEPVLRSLAYALLKRESENPAKADLPPDRPGRRAAELARKVQYAWQDGKPSPEATADLLSTLRTGSDEDAQRQVVELLNKEVAPQSIWDAILSGGGELLMRQPGIATLHSLTSANAMRYAYEASGDPRTRLMLLLQNAAFVPLFRGMIDKGKVSAPKVRVDQFEPAEPKSDGADAVNDIFATAGRSRMEAASKALGYLKGPEQAKQLIQTARRLVFLKGRDAHDYKFSSAVLEDYYHLSPQVRDRYLAAAMFYLPSTAAKDNDLVKRARAALG